MKYAKIFQICRQMITDEFGSYPVPDQPIWYYILNDFVDCYRGVDSLTESGVKQRFKDRIEAMKETLAATKAK